MGTGNVLLSCCVVSEKKQNRGWEGKRKFEAAPSLDGKAKESLKFDS